MAKNRKKEKHRRSAQVISKKPYASPVTKTKKNSRKLFWAVVTLIAGVLIVLAGFFFIVESVPTDFTLKLSQVGDLQLVYFDQQSEKISPLCGCKEIGEWANWRGITFTSRRLDISRKGGLPVTGYLIFPAYPAPTRIYPGVFKMKVDYYLLRIGANDTFNAQSLISSSVPRNYEVLKREQSDEGFIQICSGADLKVALLGDKPLGTWIPVERSIVSMKYEFKQDIASPMTRTIRKATLQKENGKLQVGQYASVFILTNSRLMLGRIRM